MTQIETKQIKMKQNKLKQNQIKQNVTNQNETEQIEIKGNKWSMSFLFILKTYLIISKSKAILRW